MIQPDQAKYEIYYPEAIHKGKIIKEKLWSISGIGKLEGKNPQDLFVIDMTGDAYAEDVRMFELQTQKGQSVSTRK